MMRQEPKQNKLKEISIQHQAFVIVPQFLRPVTREQHVVVAQGTGQQLLDQHAIRGDVSELDSGRVQLFAAG